MKKIFITISSLILLLLFVNPSKAYAQIINNDTNIQEQFVVHQSGYQYPGDSAAYVLGDFGWTYTVGEDINDPNIYINSPRVQVTADYLQSLQVPNYVIHKDWDGNYSVQVNAFTNAYVYVYTSEDAQYPSNISTLSNFGPGGQSSYRLNSPIALGGTKWIQIRFTISLYSVVGQQLSNDTHPIIKAYFTEAEKSWVNLTPNNFNNRMRRYTASIRLSFRDAWIVQNAFMRDRNHYSQVTIREQIEFTPPETPDDYNIVTDLPSTTGSIYTNSTGMGNVTFNVDGLQLEAKVTYNAQDYYLLFNMENGTDMSIFTNANKNFYYMYEGERFFLINHGNESIFQASNLGTQKWVGYTVWNLSTNEISTFDRLNVYLYSKLEEANNVYGYFYIDQFVIDRLLSVSLSMRYRYNYVIGQSDWKIHNKVLEADVFETFDPTSWQLDVLAGTALATGVLALIPGVQMPALLVGSAVMAIVGSTIQSPPISFGTINQIELIQPSVSLQQEINAAYAASNPGFNPNATNMNIYKLYIGQFNDAWSTGIKIDTEYSLYQQQQGINIVQLTYVTDNKLYVIDGDNIDMNFTPGTGTDGNSPGFSFPDLDLASLIAVLGGLTVAVMVLVSSIQSGVLFNRRRGFNFGMFVGTLFGALMSGGLVGIIVYFGVNAFLGGG